MEDFTRKFNKKLEITSKNGSKGSKGICLETLSKKSLMSIGQHAIGETLNDRVVKHVGEQVRGTLIKVLDDAFTYARRTRASELKIEHVMVGMKEHGLDNLNMWHIDYDLDLDDKEGKKVVPSRPKKNAPDDSLSNGLSYRMYPLSKEQSQHYIKLTESIMGTSEPIRQRMLDSAKNDPALQPMLAELCVFIADGVKLHIVEQNMEELSYLLRLTRSLMDNPFIRLDNCVSCFSLTTFFGIILTFLFFSYTS